MVRYLASDLGEEHRVNAISAGAIKTLAAARLRLLEHPAGLPRSSALRGVDQSEVADAALFLTGNGGRAITGRS